MMVGLQARSRGLLTGSYDHPRLLKALCCKGQAGRVAPAVNSAHHSGFEACSEARLPQFRITKFPGSDCEESEVCGRER